MSKQNIKNVIETHIETQLKSGKNSGLPAETQSNNIIAIIDALTVSKGLGITIETVELLGSSGVTVKNACSLLHKSFQFFDDNPTMLEAFNRGRASLGSRVRSKLIEAALEGGNIQSAIHLDKIYSADSVTEVNITVGQSQLSTVSDEELMKVAFDVDTDSSDDTLWEFGLETRGGVGNSAVLGFHRDAAT